MWVRSPPPGPTNTQIYKIYMNIEEIKLITETLIALGDKGFIAFIIYLFVDKIFTLGTICLSIFAFYKIMKLLVEY